MIIHFHIGFILLGLHSDFNATRSFVGPSYMYFLLCHGPIFQSFVGVVLGGAVVGSGLEKDKF